MMQPRQVSTREPAQTLKSKWVSPFDDVAMTRALQAPDWFLDDCISPESVTILAGTTNIGKTTFAFELACCVASGMDTFGGDNGLGIHCLKSGVIYVGVEGGELSFFKAAYGFQDRFGEEWARDAAKNLRLCVETNARLRGVPGVPQLREDVLRQADKMDEDVQLVVFDTLQRLSGAQDDNASTEAAAVFTQLERLRDELDCVVLTVGHPSSAVRKDHDGDPTGTLRGSSVMVDAADSALMLKPPNGMRFDEAKEVGAVSLHSLKQRRGRSRGRVADYTLKEGLAERDGRTVTYVYPEFNEETAE